MNHTPYPEALGSGADYSRTINEMAHQLLVDTSHARVGDNFDIDTPSGDTNLPFRIISSDGEDLAPLATVHLGNVHDVTGYKHPAIDGEIAEATEEYVIFRVKSDNSMWVQKLTMDEATSGVAVTSEQRVKVDDTSRGTSLTSDVMGLRLRHIPDQDRIWITTQYSSTAPERRFAPYATVITGRPVGTTPQPTAFL